MLEQYDQISEAAAAIARQWSLKPTVGIILGSGLGGVTTAITEKVTIPYESIPHFAKSTAHGHAGQLVCGFMEGVPVVVMEGRMHAYEGYPLAQIAFPVRVLKRLGANLLVVTNACGGLNPHYRTGDLMVIDDHINLINDNPLVGINDERLGPAFPTCQRPTRQNSSMLHWLLRDRKTFLRTAVFMLPWQGQTSKRGRSIAFCARLAPMLLVCQRSPK